MTEYQVGDPSLSSIIPIYPIICMCTYHLMVLYPKQRVALGFIFLLPPFSPIRFFLCHFPELRDRFLAIFRQNKSQVFGHLLQLKSLLSLTPLILVDYSIHIDIIAME